MRECWKACVRRAVTALCALLCVLAEPAQAAEIALHRVYQPDWESVGNPLMGYAPGAERAKVSDDVQLVYMDITWRELEPEKGVFAFEEIVRENRLEEWREAGRHVVLRFLCDYPGRERHMDIPDWLYEEMDGDGTWYSTSYGRGFSPNYANEKMIAYHALAVRALGEYFGQDTQISYVEIGVLGHWGEWHVRYQDGIDRLPDAQIRERYLLPWVVAFPKAQLLMRRPFAAAETYGLGLFNDMAGDWESTQEWLAWIEDGGAYEQTGEEDGMVPISDFWEYAPSGGELAASAEREMLQATKLAQTVELLRQAHTTFLGPSIADAEYKAGYDELLRNMGYRYYVREATLKPEDGAATLEMTWSNLGVAPMYWDWPVVVYVWDEFGRVLESVDTDLALSELLPGQEAHVSVPVTTPGVMEAENGYSVGVGVLDPMTWENAVRLDMHAERINGATVLFSSGQ